MLDESLPTEEFEFVCDKIRLRVNAGLPVDSDSTSDATDSKSSTSDASTTMADDSEYPGASCNLAMDLVYVMT